MTQPRGINRASGTVDGVEGLGQLAFGGGWVGQFDVVQVEGGKVEEEGAWYPDAWGGKLFVRGAWAPVVAGYPLGGVT